MLSTHSQPSAPNSSPIAEHNLTISAMVADDYRTAAIFEKYGIDFCCRGNRTLAEAAHAKGVKESLILQDLAALSPAVQDASSNYQLWSTDFLINYVVENHHGFVRTVTPPMEAHVEKIADVHGRNHPELVRVRDLFLMVTKELGSHMRVEEQVLFPYISSLALAQATGIQPAGLLNSVEDPIGKMLEDHETVGAAMEEIRNLTNDYTPPEDGCTTYRVTLAELKAFEEDLHKHVHLENYVLFPRAVELERSSQLAA